MFSRVGSAGPVGPGVLRRFAINRASMPLTAISRAYRFLWPRAVLPPVADREMVAHIRQLAETYAQLSDAALRCHTDDLREAVAQGTDLVSKNILLPGTALVVEAARRTLGINYYDVQLLAGLALARGLIAEMQTGEGKTFVAAFPAFVRSLDGRGVHVMTVNAYLAERDYTLMAPLYELLGLRVGYLRPQADRAEKKQAYADDITYGPGYEFGFDYLRDQVALMGSRQPRLGEGLRDRLAGRQSPATMTMQRGHRFAVVDEIDSVMLDEATTPLLLSDGLPGDAPNAATFRLARDQVSRLQADRDYVLDRKARAVKLTPAGQQQILLHARQVAATGLDRPWPTYVEQALHAQLIFRRDVDYVVRDGKLLLVDENTGRIFEDRSWRDGLHQAVQAKEQVPITTENRPIAQISRQRYFRLYDGLCGMSGTVTGAEREFHRVYGLSVVTIPTWKPCRRRMGPTRFFAHESAKWSAIVGEIERRHATGQPILVGTWSIQNSETVAQLCAARRIPYQLLNGKQDVEEAEIVAQAGQVGMVTIATNMAGRGTDIKLGPAATERGGLHVIGTERHESPRVDRQLAGRAARQGDPGSCQFFVSADDYLLRQHARALARRMQGLGGADGEIHTPLARTLVQVQQRAERRNCERRRQVLAHTDWLEDVLAKLSGED
jgi:preprotein translocase subunit SecA